MLLAFTRRAQRSVLNEPLVAASRIFRCYLYQLVKSSRSCEALRAG